VKGIEKDGKGCERMEEGDVGGNFRKKFGEGDELYWGGSVFMILVERPKFKFSSKFQILFKIQKG
jgi:hypothetical protein